MPEPEHIDRPRTALVAYDVCRRALAPSDPERRAAMRPVLNAWVQMIAAARAAGVPVIYTTPVSRADGADVVMLPTDLSAETGVPPLTNAVEGTVEAGFPDEIAPRPEDYVETSVREAFNLDLASVVVRECCWSGDTAAHAYSLDKAMKMYARIRSLDQVAEMLRVCRTD
jgi:nicotinamidase-related amidase